MVFVTRFTFQSGNIDDVWDWFRQEIIAAVEADFGNANRVESRILELQAWLEFLMVNRAANPGSALPAFTGTLP